MGENGKPKLRLIRGDGEDPLVHSDNLNPNGIPRPRHLLPAAGTPRTPMVNTPPKRTQKGRGASGNVRPSSSQETYVESDPTPPQGTVRPKRLRVVKDGKE